MIERTLRRLAGPDYDARGRLSDREFTILSHHDFPRLLNMTADQLQQAVNDALEGLSYVLMKYPIDVVMPSGAVVLGSDVVCDGFVRQAVARVQTHVHLDHMHNFETSKGCQQIIASQPTISLLIAEFNADLPFRSNITALPEFQGHKVGDSEVTLVSSGHMLGAVQVVAELESGMRLGYSGDFPVAFGPSHRS